MSDQAEEIGQEPRGIMVVVEFDRSLLNHFTVAEWNVFVGDLLTKGLIPAVWSGGEQRPPPATFFFDFRGLQRAHYHLNAIDLSLCHLDQADFTGASLKCARLGSGKNINYRGARLHGADFSDLDISGCDFTESLGIEATMFAGASYDPANPPMGLPPEVVAVCKAEAEEPSVAPRKPSSPTGQSFYTESPLRCSVTIQKVPME